MNFRECLFLFGVKSFACVVIYIYIYTRDKIYRNMVFPVLYGCEIWPFILKVEHSPRVIENKVLRRIFRHNKAELRREWRRLHNELRDLYS